MTTDRPAKKDAPGASLPLFLDAEIARLRERWHRASHGFERRPLVERIRALEALHQRAQDGQLTAAAFEAALESWERRRQPSLPMALPVREGPLEVVYEDLLARWRAWKRRPLAPPAGKPGG